MNKSKGGVSTLVQALKNAKNDSQKCAALLAVSKLVKANELTSDHRRDIFLAVGYSFSLRLLTSTADDDDGSKDLFVNLGLSLLSSFACDEELIKLPENITAIPIVIKIIEENYQKSIPDQDALTDCFRFLASVSTIDENCSTLLRHNGIKSLVKAFCRLYNSFENSLFWVILLRLLNFDGESIWSDNQDDMIILLNLIAELISSDYTKKKFEMFSQLCAILELFPATCCNVYFEQKWVSCLKNSLNEVLHSKISAKERAPTLRLCHCLTRIFGLKWASPDKNSNFDKKFLILLIRLSCIEVKMIVYEWINWESLDKIYYCEEMPLFIVCSALIEAACSCIAEFDFDKSVDEVFTFDDINQLKGPLSETMESITLNLLPAITDIPRLSDVVAGCVRTVGSWLNIQNFASSKVGLNMLKIIFEAFKVCLINEPAAAIKSLTPAFLHYAEIESARSCLIELGIISTLTSTFEISELSDESKSLSAQSLMAICLESAEVDKFVEILPLIMTNSIKLKQSNICLSFYMITLALIIWNKLSEEAKEFPQIERFFQAVISLLHVVHTREGYQVKLTKR